MDSSRLRLVQEVYGLRHMMRDLSQAHAWISRVPRVVAVVAGISSWNCGGPTRVDVWLECPSPDRTVIAVLWARAGGGAAGWSQQLLSILPSDVPVEQTPERQTGDQAPVLAISSGEAFELRWETNDRLSVTVAYSDQSTIYSMRHGQMIPGRRPIRLIYHERESERHPFSLPQRRCEAGGQRTENPPARRLR